jgi:phosphoribosylglycinamide formyltransferase-1
MSGLRVGVLVSGSGTNLQAILDAEKQQKLGDASVVLVISNRPGVAALERAQRAGVAAEVVDHTTFAERTAFEEAVIARLRAAQVELVVLAGFMLLLDRTVLQAFPHHVLYFHPALLPAFPGVDGQGQALRHGVKIAGCTVHFVDEGTDSGPIIAQAAVPVLDQDDEETLRLRILAEEHRILPQAIRWIAEGRVALHRRRVLVEDATASPGILRSPEVEP